MNAVPPAVVKLTRKEKALLEQIDFDSHQRDDLRRSCAAAKPLVLSLLEREVIPQIRLDYFTDPQYNIGASVSCMQVFERNGQSGEAIFGHAHFLKHLHYWISGPLLPPETILGFCRVVNDDAGTSAMCQYARQQTRSHRLDRHDAATEFHRLALETGLDPGTSRSIRDAVMRVR